MDIRTLRYYAPQFEEALYMGKEAVISGVPVVIAGIFRMENSRLKLYLFAEGEDMSEQRKKEEELAKKRRRGTLTRREELLLELAGQKDLLLDIIRGIRVNGTEYEMSSGSGGRLEEYDVEGKMLLYHFLYRGVPFGFLEERELSLIQYVEMELEGEYERLPFSEEDMDTLEFLTIPRNYPVPVKQSMKLSLGEQKGSMQKFFCEELQKYVEYSINNIELVDTWSEMKAQYDKMIKREHLEREHGFSQRDWEQLLEALGEICPEGMRNLLVEYECEEASLEFYTKEQLKEKVKICGGATSFFLAGTNKKGTGIHGKKLRSCLVQYPVEPKLQEVELELLRAYVQESADSKMGDVMVL